MPEKRQIKPSAFKCCYIFWHDKVDRNGKMKIKQMNCHFGVFSSAPPSCQIGTKCPFNKFTIMYNNSDELHWEPDAWRRSTGLCNFMQCRQTSLQTVFNIHILNQSSWKTQTDHHISNPAEARQYEFHLDSPREHRERKKVRGNKDDASWELILLLSWSVIQNYNYI